MIVSSQLSVNLKHLELADRKQNASRRSGETHFSFLNKACWAFCVWITWHRLSVLRETSDFICQWVKAGYGASELLPPCPDADLTRQTLSTSHLALISLCRFNIFQPCFPIMQTTLSPHGGVSIQRENITLLNLEPDLCFSVSSWQSVRPQPTTCSLDCCDHLYSPVAVTVWRGEAYFWWQNVDLMVRLVVYSLLSHHLDMSHKLALGLSSRGSQQAVAASYKLASSRSEGSWRVIQMYTSFWLAFPWSSPCMYPKNLCVAM